MAAVVAVALALLKQTIAPLLIVVLLLTIRISHFVQGEVPLVRPPTVKKMARLQLDINEEIKQRLKVQAVTRGKTMSEVVEEALAMYLPQLESSIKP